MSIKMQIKNIKNIDEFDFEIPSEKGLYALTGENASGKSTIISCAASMFYVPSFIDYFGKPRNGAKIEFSLNNQKRIITEKEGKWVNPKEFLNVKGFYEGSIVFGNRFKDLDVKLLKKLSTIDKENLIPSSDFIKKSLGEILHDNEAYYNTLKVTKPSYTKSEGLTRNQYYYENKGVFINQLNMSTGENLLLTILDSLEKRLKKRKKETFLSFLLLDEIELALHSSALRRLVFFLKKISDENDIVVIFSTHSIELIRSIPPEKIYYLQNYPDKSIKIINPCYPVYATRNLEASNYGHDYILMVEDNLSKIIVEKILRERELLSNKKVLVIPVGGWTQVLTFAYDAIKSNLMPKTTKIIIILDEDVKEEVKKFMKNKKINFSTEISYLPIKSLEKYLIEKLSKNIDHDLFNRLNDYVFQGKSLNDIVKEYKKNTSNEEDQDGKKLYSALRHELKCIRREDQDLVDVIVKYLFNKYDDNLKKLTDFLQENLK